MSVIVREGVVDKLRTETMELGQEDGRDSVAMASAHSHRFVTGTRSSLTRQVTIDVDGMQQGDSTEAENAASAQRQSRAGRNYSRLYSNSSQTSMSKSRRKQRGQISRMSTSSVQIISSSSRVEGGSFSSMKSRISEISSVHPSDEESDSEEEPSSDVGSEDPCTMTNDSARHSRYVISHGTDYHHTKSLNQMHERALAERRTALISGLDFLPFCEPDHTFPKFEALVRSEARCVQRPQLKRARAHYKKMAERFPTNYVALVNLACCHALLASHAKAVPLLVHAIEQSPEKAPAHVNLVLCLVELQDHKAALAAIEHTFSTLTSGKVAAELSRSQKSLLLRCKAAIYFRSHGDDNKAMQICCEAANAAAAEDPIDAPHETRCGGLAFVNKEGDILDEVNLRLELRDGIEELKSMQDDTFQKTKQKPPWGRRHAFGCDKSKFDLAEQQGIGKWCHLRPDQVDELRKHLKLAKFQEDRGTNAYETARMLTFFNRLEPQHAIKILNLAELIEMKPDECVFKQGDVAEFMYVIAMGSVHIVVTDEDTYGPYPVTIDTFYDGQSFGESAYAEDAGASIRRATVVAQEHCVLLRFRPADYRRVIGVTIPENRGECSEYAYGSSNTVGSTDEPSAELLLHRGDALETRMKKLKGVPCFAACPERDLTRLASHAQEISLRYGDIIVAVGKEPRGCFVIRDGFCKVFAPVDAGHRARDRRHCITDNSSQASGSRSPSKTRCKEETHKLDIPCGSAAAAAARIRSGGLMRRTLHAGAITLAHPPRVRTPVVKSWTRHKKVGRRPGTPRARTPWAESLRGGELSFATGDKVAKEVDLGYLSPGQAFGLGAMFDKKEEATATVQVDSDVARVLVLTQRSLLYLPDTLVSTVMEKSNDMVDPVRPTPEDIRIARKQQRTWAAEKRKMISEEMTTIV